MTTELNRTENGLAVRHFTAGGRTPVDREISPTPRRSTIRDERRRGIGFATLAQAARLAVCDALAGVSHQANTKISHE